jgi:hypothetical protein
MEREKGTVYKDGYARQDMTLGDNTALYDVN